MFRPSTLSWSALSQLQRLFVPLDEAPTNQWATKHSSNPSNEPTSSGPSEGNLPLAIPASCSILRPPSSKAMMRWSGIRYFPVRVADDPWCLPHRGRGLLLWSQCCIIICQASHISSSEFTQFHPATSYICSISRNIKSSRSVARKFTMQSPRFWNMSTTKKVSNAVRYRGCG